MNRRARRGACSSAAICAISDLRFEIFVGNGPRKGDYDGFRQCNGFSSSDSVEQHGPRKGDYDHRSRSSFAPCARVEEHGPRKGDYDCRSTFRFSPWVLR